MTAPDRTALGEAAVAADEAQTGISVGDTVIAWEVDKPVTYGGPDEHGSSMVWVIGIGTGAMTRAPVRRKGWLPQARRPQRLTRTATTGR